MIRIEKARRQRRCSCCSFEIKKDSLHIRFYGGVGNSTTVNNLCRDCMNNFINGKFKIHGKIYNTSDPRISGQLHDILDA